MPWNTPEPPQLVILYMFFPHFFYASIAQWKTKDPSGGNVALCTPEAVQYTTSSLKMATLVTSKTRNFQQGFDFGGIISHYERNSCSHYPLASLPQQLPPGLL